MTDWRAAYNGLSKAGYTDEQIGQIAGYTRAIINSVRNGNYPHHHEPGHSGGQAVLNAITEAVRCGYLDEDPLTRKP